MLAPLVALHAVAEIEFEKQAPALIEALGDDSKKPVHPVVLRVLTATKPKSFRAAVEAVAKVIVESQEEDAQLRAVLGAGGPVDIPRAEFDKIQNRADRDQLAALRKTIDAFTATNPAAPPRAHVLNDAPTPFDPYVFLRGNQANHGPTVPRQFLEITSGQNRKPFTDGSGRLELAKAIASPDNPLTARVFVNRVWIGHFGQGLVRTPSDFGLRSDPPTHPELLDWLARRFMDDGWSVKRLHKLIMLSAVYQQSSNAERGAGNAERRRVVFGIPVPSSTFPVPRFEDPENRLLSHQNRRRLDFEAMRDSLLAAAGRLDPAIGGRPVDLFKAPFSTRRSVYGLIDRTNFPGTMRSFDVASPDQHSPQRFQTTVPQQALFLLNSPFVGEQAKSIMNRPEIKAATAVDEKLTRLYRAVLGRKPSRAELELGRAFVAPPHHWAMRAAEASRPFGKWQHN